MGFMGSLLLAGFGEVERADDGAKRPWSFSGILRRGGGELGGGFVSVDVFLRNCGQVRIGLFGFPRGL
jgi:hypothetical protein